VGEDVAAVAVVVGVLHHQVVSGFAKGMHGVAPNGLLCLVGGFFRKPECASIWFVRAGVMHGGAPI
jgi:hypothetical protein